MRWVDLSAEEREHEHALALQDIAMHPLWGKVLTDDDHEVVYVHDPDDFEHAGSDTHTNNQRGGYTLEGGYI